MARTELRCDAPRGVPNDAEIIRMLNEAGYHAKCGRLLARSPELGERVQFIAGGREYTGEVWLVDHERHVSCVRVTHVDTIAIAALAGALAPEAREQLVAWSALRPCNGEPVR